jgi:hypothetical protein
MLGQYRVQNKFTRRYFLLMSCGLAYLTSTETVDCLYQSKPVVGFPFRCVRSGPYAIPDAAVYFTVFDNRNKAFGGKKILCVFDQTRY